MSIRKSLIAVGAAAAFVLAGCSSSSPESSSPEEKSDTPAQTLNIKASFYPLQYLVEQVGGDHVSVESLTPPGTDAHALELSPKVVSELSQSDGVVYLKGFQEAVDSAVKEAGPAHVLDVTKSAHIEETGAHDHHDHDEHAEEGHDHDADEHAEEGHDHDEHAEEGHDHDEHAEEGHDHDEHAEEGHDHDEHGEEGHEEHHHHHNMAGDPHFWLDASRMADVSVQVGDFLAEVDPANADFYKKNAQTVSGNMKDLAEEMKSGLSNCKQDTFITSHEAFGYLAKQTGLHQVGVSGLDPEVAPSPQRLKEISKLVKDTNSKVIYTEVNVSPKVMQVLAKDLGIETMTLDPGATQNDPNKDYVDIMKQDLENLQKGLDCK